MPNLEPPNTHYLSAALGWVELGNPTEAKAELARIELALWKHPDVLEVRWLVAAAAPDWDAGLQIARDLIQVSPERPSGWLHQAYSLRRASSGGLRQAWEALLPVSDRFPREATVAYNLACYACQMRQMDAARVWFKKATRLGDQEHLKAMALQDPDLKELWDEIRESA